MNMEIKDIVIGMKVIPIGDGRMRSLKEILSASTPSSKFLRNNGYLIVKRVEGRWVSCSDDEGNFRDFSNENIKPYIEPKQTKKEEQRVSKITQQEMTKREKGRKVKDLHQSLGIEKVIVNNPVVVVFFKDGTKQVEKCVDKGAFNVDCGLALAVLHHSCGSKAIFKDVVKKILK
jgi:hypothetical protein